MHSNRTERNIRYLLAIILLHVLWLTGAFVWKHIHNGDTDDYIYLALNIKKGIYYSASTSAPLYDFGLSNRTPLYSLLILLFYTVFGVNDWPIVIFQNILSIVSCWMLLKLFLQQFPVKKQAWIYLLFLVFYPAQMCFASVLAPDIVMQFLLVLYFKELMTSLQSPPQKSMAKMGVWLLLAALTKPVIYPFLILHIAYSFWYYFKTRTFAVVFLGFMPFLFMVGYGFWNKSRTGIYHISSVQNDNLLNSNARGFLTFKYGQAYSDSVLDAANARIKLQPGLKAKYELAAFEAKTIMKAHPFAYCLYHFKESLRFFVAPGKFDLDIFTGLGTDKYQPEAPSFYTEFNKNGIAGAWTYLKAYALFPLIMLIVGFNFLRIIGWVLFLCDKQYSPVLKIFSSIYILYFAVITGPVSNTRYFLPVLLIMSALSMLGFAGLMNRKKRNLMP